MKKILFILIICIIKLNAYEYMFYHDTRNNTSVDIKYFTDINGNLNLKFVYENGREVIYNTEPQFYNQLHEIKIGIAYYIGKNKFNELLTNDLSFLNDFYTQRLNSFLNYLYNNNFFNANNYINYTDYELLYNSEGLAVESIVNGIWRGLYDGPDNSGYLYNEKEDLKYINGVPVSFFQRINDKLMKKFKINLESIFIKKIFYPLLVLIFACVIFRTVIRMAVKAFLIRFYDNKIRRLEKRRENIENA